MAILTTILYVFMLLASIFLILLVLIQRGRGGGLAGALGGMGGYSAFGTRAGDLFTKITIVAASLWILVAMVLARINLSKSQAYVNPGQVPARSQATDRLKPSHGAPTDDAAGTGPADDEAAEKSEDSGQPKIGKRFLEDVPSEGSKQDATKESEEP